MKIRYMSQESTTTKCAMKIRYTSQECTTKEGATTKVHEPGEQDKKRWRETPNKPGLAFSLASFHHVVRDIQLANWPERLASMRLDLDLDEGECGRERKRKKSKNIKNYDSWRVGIRSNDNFDRRSPCTTLRVHSTHGQGLSENDALASCEPTATVWT